MGITVNLNSYPFYNGTGTSSQVPKVFTVSLNGRNYMVDFNQPFYRQYRRQLAPLIRTQADTSTVTGEQTLDPTDLWRRSQEDWSLGAGQTYLDRKDSLPNRYRSSKGIDIWTKWQIGLLPDTLSIRSSANTNLGLCSVGSYFYITDGTALLFTQDITVPVPTWTTVTGTPGVAISSITSDGFNVWIAVGASGTYTTTAGAATASQYNTTAIDSAAIVSFLKGRLMLASTNKIYNIIASGALPAVLFTHSNTNFKWIGFADGKVNIYAGGYSGDRSFIYGFTILTDGTALNAPIVQGELPDGETLSSIYGAVGFLFLGSNKGVRFATTESSGAIVIQSLIPTTSAVNAIVTFDRFAWYGWTNYDGASTGLGRMDLQNFAIPGAQPAYSSDLMATTQGAVIALDTFQNQRVFSVSGIGIYTSSSTQLVSSGTIDSGFILYNLPDIKVALQLLVQSPVPLPAGSYQAYLSADGGLFVSVGIHKATDLDPVRFSVAQVSAQKFEVRMTLTRDASLLLISPTISRFTLRAWPSPRRPLIWQVPVLLDESTINTSGSTDGFDPLTELQALEFMAASGKLVSYQEGNQAYSVLVSDVEFLPDYLTEDRRYFNGICLLQLKGVPT